MQNTTSMITKELVLIGGGHAHAGVIKKFAMKPLPGLRLTLITRDIHTPYSGMLPGLIAGHYQYDDCHIDLQKLCRFANARLIHGEVKGINPEKKQILLPNRPAVYFDLASINIGSTPDKSNISGADNFAISAKPVDIFLQKWQQLQKRFLDCKQDFHLVIVGGGAGGVELALSTQYQLQKLLQHCKNTDRKLTVSLVTASEHIMFSHNKSVQKKFHKLFQQRNIHILNSTRVTEVKADRVITDQAQAIPCDAVIWATSASAPKWLAKTGLELDKQGFIRVNPFLQSTSHSNIFAAGDIASLAEPRPKSGVFAVRQGPYLAHNLRAKLLKKSLRTYKPQKNFLGLISTGDQYAIASRGNWSFGSHWLWTLKDWIDRRFMRQFIELPEMEAEKSDINPALLDNNTLEQLQAHPVRCAGCGAKVGANSLSRVLKKLPQKQREDVLLGTNQADDAAVIELKQKGTLLVQSVDYFRAFMDDNYLFGAIAANHALGDLYAMGATPQSALAIATLPFASEKITEQNLYQLLSGAVSVLHSTGAVLAGGHSSEGTETAFGLTVNGLAQTKQLMRKNALKDGDKLVLTKPIGTGVLLAADMRWQARGRWVDNAVQTMLLSNQTASEILLSFGVKACTDITGFGLAGHLLEMLQASACSAQINLDAIALLEGASECSKQGIRSSLFEQNQSNSDWCIKQNHLTEHPAYPLLFDPQTAGGLLAAVSADKAEQCLQTLQASYPQSRIIGTVLKEENSKIYLSK